MRSLRKRISIGEARRSTPLTIDRVVDVALPSGSGKYRVIPTHPFKKRGSRFLTCGFSPPPNQGMASTPEAQSSSSVTPNRMEADLGLARSWARTCRSARFGLGQNRNPEPVVLARRFRSICACVKSKPQSTLQRFAGRSPFSRSRFQLQLFSVLDHGTPPTGNGKPRCVPRRPSSATSGARRRHTSEQSLK